MAKKPYTYCHWCDVIDRATGADLGQSQTVWHTVYPDGTDIVTVTGENTIKDLEACKEKMAAHLSDTANEIYARRPEAFDD